MSSDHENLSWVPVITPDRVQHARKTLGLGEAATFEEIRDVYRQLARRYHPDGAPPERHSEYSRMFRKISAAYAYLKVLIRNYRYDLSEEAVKRDQEPADIRHRRRFGGGLYGEESGEDFQDDPSRGQLRLTAENVTLARKRLGLLKLTTGEQLRQRFRDLVGHHSRADDTASESTDEAVQINRCYELLQHLMATYRYSFRPGDIAEKQQDQLESHRKRHGNDPVWAGGTYDDSEDDPYPDLDFERSD